jgi:hypothetical protein
MNRAEAIATAELCNVPIIGSAALAWSAPLMVDSFRRRF